MNNKDVFNRSLTVNRKIIYFLGAWFLTNYIVFEALSRFLYTLNTIKIISLPENYQILNLEYNEVFIVFILRLIIFTVTSICLGIVYVYLTRRVDKNDLVSICFANGLLLLIILPSFYLYLYTLSLEEKISFSNFADIVDKLILTNPNIYLGIIVSFILISSGCIIGVYSGKRLIKGLPEKKGQLLGVKWYHMIWLAPAFITYIQFILYLIYLTIKTISSFFADFNIFKSLANDTSSESSITSTVLLITIFYIIGYIIFVLAKKQRDVLDRSIKTPVVQKIAISLLFGFIIPFIIFNFTVVR